MARGGRITVRVDYSEVEQNLIATLNRVERGTKKATLAAAEEILQNSLSRVPKDTETLAASAFIQIYGKSRNFSAVVGYGGNGDPVNPKTGERASQYMVEVHEDLNANHPNGGEAKFLENAVTEYQQRFLPATAKILKSELRL